MELSPWKGLFSNASPHVVPPGGAQIQENLMSMRPGVLEVRRGQANLASGNFASSLFMTKVRRGGLDGIAYCNLSGGVSFYGIAGIGMPVAPVASGYLPCIAQARQGDIVVVGGAGRGAIGLYSGSVGYAIGISAPSAGPLVIAAAGTGGYASSTYYFGYRWGDAIGRWSSLSPLTTVATGTGNWNFTITTVAAVGDRITKMEIYRSLADDPNDLYRVASFASGGQQIYVDSTTDNTLVGNAYLPIQTDEGSLVARRHDIPPTNVTLVCPFQGRMFYAGQGTVDDANRNRIWFSEDDLPESVPADQNNLIMVDDFGDPDDVRALFAFSGVLYFGKRRHLYRMTFSSDPRFDASISIERNRGILQQRAFAVYRDTVFLLDDTGPWQLGGQDDFDGPIRNYWIDGLIDYAKSDRFFVAVEPTEQVVRYYIVLKGYGWNYPKAALCYSITTQTWWLEKYNEEYYGACVFPYQGRVRTVVASSKGLRLLSEGVVDLDSTLTESGIQYRYRTGIIPIDSGDQKAQHVLTLTYDPIDSATPNVAEEVRIRLYFDHEDLPVACWGGFKEGRARATHGSPDLIVDLKRNTDTHGAVGYERLNVPVKGYGLTYGHRFVAIELVGIQQNYAHRFYGLEFS